MSGRKPRSRWESEAGGPESPRTERGARSWCRIVGMISLLVWLVGGGVLEALHGFKAPLYLQDALRREMWTLAHAHGTLFSLACLVLSGLRPADGASTQEARLADRLFAAGAVLLPCGFLLGGASHSESDPGLGILLVPAGGLLAAAALITMIAEGAFRAAR